MEVLASKLYSFLAIFIFIIQNRKKERKKQTRTRNKEKKKKEGKNDVHRTEIGVSSVKDFLFRNANESRVLLYIALSI